MIKPDAVKAGHIGAILNQICEAGFKIVAMKYTKLSAEKAGEFMPFTVLGLLCRIGRFYVILDLL